MYWWWVPGYPVPGYIVLGIVLLVLSCALKLVGDLTVCYNILSMCILVLFALNYQLDGVLLFASNCVGIAFVLFMLNLQHKAAALVVL